MDNYPISSNSLEKHYHINGNYFWQQYKEHLSDFQTWEQKSHAKDWIFFPDNTGTRLSIDETALTNGELYTIVTNKAAKGKKGALVAMIEGTDSEATILFELYPDLKQAYSLTHALRMILSKNTDKGVAYTKMAKWFNDVTGSGFKSFNTISATFYSRYPEILNFFDNRGTNASAESFNAKLKASRATLRGVVDIEFFLFRVAKIYA